MSLGGVLDAVEVARDLPVGREQVDRRGVRVLLLPRVVVVLEADGVGDLADVGLVADEEVPAGRRRRGRARTTPTTCARLRVAVSGVSFGSMLIDTTSNSRPTVHCTSLSARTVASSTRLQSIGHVWYAKTRSVGRLPSK